jgi:hypothetical protein
LLGGGKIEVCRPCRENVYMLLDDQRKKDGALNLPEQSHHGACNVSHLDEK